MAEPAREDVLALRLCAPLQFRSHAGVEVAFDAASAVYTVSWYGGPDEDTMREYVREESEPYDYGRVEYDRKPMPDLEVLAVEAVRMRDPRGWWSASRQRRETAEALRRLQALADESGYTAVQGFMRAVREASTSR